MNSRPLQQIKEKTNIIKNQMTLQDSISFQHYTEIICIFVRNYFSSTLNPKKFIQFIPEQLPVKKISKLETFSHQLQKFGINLALKQLNEILSPLQKEFQLIDYLKFKESHIQSEDFDEQDNFLDDLQQKLLSLIEEIQAKRRQRMNK